MQYQKENVSLDQPYCSFNSWTKIIFKLQMDNNIIKKKIEKVFIMDRNDNDRPDIR
jgi:hypothetical protein